MLDIHQLVSPGGDGVGVETTAATRRTAPLKTERERIDIICAYREVGTYRGAADLGGTTHKTVKRIIEADETGRPPSAGRGSGPATTTSSPMWWPGE